MPINTKYAGYDEAMKKITRVRDFAEGSDAVKDKGVVYLPMLGGQSQTDYDSYKTRGYLIPAVSPTAKAIKGSIMRRPPVFNPTGAEYLIDDFTGNGTSVTEFVGDMITELLYAGGIGYLVEFNDKPFAKPYTRENIINFSSDYIVLTQTYMVQNDKDRYEQEMKTEYLELTFDEEGNYIQNIWRETKGGGKFEIIDTITPTNRSEPLKSIPFVFSSVGKIGIVNTDPILLHLANVNHDQYLLSTDHRHGLHWTALPTLFLFGEIVDEKGKPVQIKVGAGSANHISDSDAKVELLEFTGQGLGAIKSAVDDDISTMASIGAKMLTNESGGVKAAETARIDASSETATLSVIANSVDQTMMQLLKIMAEWGGFTEPEFKVNRDFIDIKLDPQALTALLATVNAGKMSVNSFLYQLEKGELLPPKVTAEDEEGRIDTGKDFNLEDA
jgi:hypothetical protein